MSLLKLLSRERASYYGNETYKHVEKLLRSESDLLIVSPYIDAYYADYLLKNSRGKNIYVISSSIKREVAKKFAPSMLPTAMRSAFLFASFNALLLLSGYFNTYLALASFGIAAAFAVFSAPAKSRVHLKIPKRFVHAKMYLGNRSAIEGSANLTYVGTHRNIEKINIISNQESIDELRNQFWKMWNSL